MITFQYLILLLLVLSEAYGDEKSSITFVIDDTGSMGNDIRQVKVGVNEIFDAVLNSNESHIEDFVLVTFNDPGTILRTITKDRNVFKNALSSIVVGGGGLCPELSMEGIIKGIVNSRPGSSIYVFTDASAKDYDRYEEVKRMALAKQIQVVFVLTGMCGTKEEKDYLVYPSLANDTKGEVFHLHKDDITIILTYVSENLKGRRTRIADKMFPPGTHSIKVKLDDFSKDPIVSATGDRPRLNITGPGGKADTKTIVGLEHITIEKIENPKPGNYTIEVSSPSKTHVIITAQTDIKFKHGFSTTKPLSIADTTIGPKPDVKSHITIKLTDGDIELKTVMILGMDDTLIKEIPLVTVNEEEKLYTTELEDLPDTLFKIAITGYDPKSKETIARVSSPIQPLLRENKAPSVSIQGSPTLAGKPDQPLQLNCSVEGYPKPNIVWVNTDSGDELHADVAAINPSSFISILKIDGLNTTTNFECRADNSLGSDSSSTNIKIILPYFTVLNKPKDTSISYHGEGELHCKVDAYPPATITWYKDASYLIESDDIDLSDNNSTLKIKEMHVADKGYYLCEVRNENVRKVLGAKITITGVERPVIHKRIESVTVPIGTDVVLTCKIITGFPKPTITWDFSDKYSGELKTLYEWSDQEVMTIRNVNKTSAGTYSCIAKNEVDSDYHEIELTVQYPPNISKDIEGIRAVEGESILMTCDVEGEPAPQVKWYKNDVEVTRRDNLYIYKSHSIRMTVGIKDRGNYTCNATNTLGTASKVVNVDVYGPVKISLPKQTKMDVNMNTTLDLPCHVTGYPMPDTEWTYRSFDRSVPAKQMLKSVGSSVLSLRYIQIEDEGYYTCTASNSEDKTNVAYEIHVLAYPVIEQTYLNKEFTAVEGDMVLIIQCKASGNPPPVISWVKNGYLVATGDDFSVENGTFTMKNISQAAAGLYTCEARNRLGFKSELYKVTVQKSPKPGPPTSTVTIGESGSSAVPCDVQHKRTDQLRWFKNGALIRIGELTISNAKLSDSGLYTCRVSNFTTSTSGNTMVKVGVPPKFIKDEETTIEYYEGSPYVLICEASGDPEPKTTWWHNGEVMNMTQNYHYFEMEVGTHGQYECEARNAFGTVTRTFNVVTEDCLIDIKKQTSKWQPLMITSYLRWPDHDVKNGFMSIPKNHQIALTCLNRFKQFPLQTLMAFCEGGSKFKIRGRIYEYSDLECTEKVTHVIEKAGESCFTGNTDLLSVSFIVKFQSIVAYEICFDADNNKPIYTTMRMGSSAADVSYAETEWADGEVIDFNPDKAYECDSQNFATSTVLQRWFHRDDQCCFSKRMLVSPKDLFPGVAQRAAYSRLNVVPHWSTCNAESNNWNEVEQRVRTLAKVGYSELVVSTGVAENLTLANAYGADKEIFVADNNSNRQNVAKYLWKVVQDPVSKSSLVIIQVNVPDLEVSEAPTYVRCRDICNTTEWMRGSSWYDVHKGFTYCCTLKDFENSFGFGGVFEPFYQILNDVSEIPKHSLT